MEQSSENRRASGAVVGVALVLLVALILGLGANGALASPGGGSGGTHIGIVR